MFHSTHLLLLGKNDHTELYSWIMCIEKIFQPTQSLSLKDIPFTTALIRVYKEKATHLAEPPLNPNPVLTWKQKSHLTWLRDLRNRRTRVNSILWGWVKAVEIGKAHDEYRAQADYAGNRLHCAVRCNAWYVNKTHCYKSVLHWGKLSWRNSPIDGGIHCPALPSVSSDDSLRFMALNQAMKVSHVLYFCW